MLLGAAEAYLEHRRDDARAMLAAAAMAFERADMTFHAAVARRRLGEVQGGECGRALVDEADAWMDGQAIRNPARMARLIAPGFLDADDV